MLLLYCRTCGSDAGLPEFCEAAGVLPVDVQNNNHQLLADVKPPAPPAPLPTPAAINGWCQKLARNSEAIIYLRDHRGINYLTVRRHRIGHDGKRFTLPVYGDGKVINLRRYLPDAVKPLVKMEGLPGHTANQLYPGMPTGEEVVVCEGEWDTLVARQNGFAAVTTTGGKDGKLVHWLDKFRGRDVVIIYDCGEAQAAGRRRAEEVVGVARSVKVVDLGLDEGEDVTDWFVKYERTAVDLQWLIAVTEPVT